MTEHIIKVPVQTVNHIDKILSLVRTGHPLRMIFPAHFQTEKGLLPFSNIGLVFAPIEVRR